MKYLKLIRNKEDQLIEDLIQLLKIPSKYDEKTISKSAPFGQPIRDALDWMLNKAQQDGFKIEDVDGYAGVISYGEGSESISMLGHLDVVPSGLGWNSDPFEPVISDGFLFARGAGDDKGPTIAAYHALKLIKELNIPLKRQIKLIVGTDEERGMSCMDYFKENYSPLPTMGFVPDADFPVIYGEKGFLNLKIKGLSQTIIKSMNAGERPNIVIGQASLLVDGVLKKDLFEIYCRQNNLSGTCHIKDGYAYYELEGKYFHASLAHRGVNAAVHLLKFVGGVYEDALSTQLGNILSDPFGQGLNIYFKGSHMGELSMNAGIISINDNQVDITLDIRYPHDSDPIKLYEQAQKVVEDLDLNLACMICSQDDPLFVDPQSELVIKCMESYKEVTGDYQTPPLTMGGGTYARMLDNHVAFGPVLPKRPYPAYVGGPHEKNEGVEIETLLIATAVYASALIKLAS